MTIHANETFSANTRPLWADTATMAKLDSQSEQVAVDVCIVGAGITGLTAATLLKKAGKTVALIELGRVGSGETSHTTAHLTEVFDIDYRDLISHFGIEGAQLASQSLRRGIERIEQNIHDYGIECDFSRVPGYQFTERSSQVDEIEDEAAEATRLGVPNEVVETTELPFHVERAVRFDHQAQMNPTAYLVGLAKRIPGEGSFIFEETRMQEVQEDHAAKGGRSCRVITDRGVIVANQVFVAANVPSSNRYFMHMKIAAYRTYAIAVTTQNNFDTKGLYWDLDEPYHYIRTFSRDGVNHLIIGGEDHKTGQDVDTSKHFQRLEEWARERFEIKTVTHRWSGQVIEPVDGLPYIGRNSLSENIFVATGYSGTGLTMGTVAAMIVSDLILGLENPWVELFEASRMKPLASIKNFISENIDYPSHMIGDRLSPAQAQGTEALREDEGAIVRVEGKKLAAYRDPGGELHLLSPVCPHMGCHVQWNNAEKSWDCPCHGSRFAPTGQLLNGPAVSDLAAASTDHDAAVVMERYEQPIQTNEGLGGPILSAFSCPYHAKA
jgi:glycine/D-amino acid oxidase-like deaminating enzyme/nitrite reductase/ring-hydroxylating ferredoxin subunit